MALGKDGKGKEGINGIWKGSKSGCCKGLRFKSLHSLISERLQG